ncbi:MAG: polysaccharide deacetylase family protein, partial [Niabella sp.]
MSLKKAIFLSFYLVAVVHLSAQTHVFITAGQSNTDGRVPNKLLPGYIRALATDTVNFTEGAYRYCKISQNRNDGQFIPYFPKGRISEGYWTYDAVTYYLLEQALQQDFYVVKYAVGGTSIQYPNDTAKGRYWSADPGWLAKTRSVENKGKSLLLSFTDAIDAAIDHTLSKIKGGYQVDAFLWHQGESDDRYAGDYYENLKAVVRHIRNHLTQKTGKDYSRLPFVFGSIPKANRHYKEEVETAMQRIAGEDPNAYLVDMSEQELQKDRTHFNERSAEYLGKEMFKVLEKILDVSATGFRIAKYKDDKTCAISYTFDDGLKEHYTLVAPKFRTLGFKGTFWINGSKINADEKNIADTTRMTWKNLQEMVRSGHEISNHSWAHKNFGRFSLEEIKEDIDKNDSAIFAHTGIMPVTFCYPNNTKTPEGVKLASQNRVGTRMVQRSVGGKSTPENLERWVNDLLKKRGWGVTMTHGITY